MFLKVADLMAEISALEKAGAVQGVKIPPAHVVRAATPQQRQQRLWGECHPQPGDSLNALNLPLRHPSAQQSKERL